MTLFSHHPPNLLARCATLTRTWQAHSPQHSKHGLTRFAHVISRLLPAYQGIIELPNHLRMYVNSDEPLQRWLLFSGNIHPELTILLQQHITLGSYCLDVGSNLGFFALHFALWAGEGGRVAAFEANPTLAELIRYNIELNGFSQVEVVNKIVHKYSTTLTFHLSPELGKSSIIPVPNATESLKLPALSLDDYLEAQVWERLDVVKMDIEGNDSNAILGAERALRRFKPFLIFESPYSNTPQSQQAFALLEEIGYSFYELTEDGVLNPYQPAMPTMGRSDIICMTEAHQAKHPFK